MKRILALLLFSMTAFGQAVNPQPDFATAMKAANPSVWARLNDNSATTFLDSISGLSFSNSASIGVTPISPTGITNQVTVNAAQTLPAGALQTVSVYYPVAPAGAQTLIVIGPQGSNGSCGSSPCFNQTDSFLVTPSAVSGWQTFTAGTGFTARNVPGAAHIGFWQSSSFANGPGQANDGQSSSFVLTTATSPANANYGVTASSVSAGIKATVTASGTITPHQPGFDLLQPQNYSVSLPYNSFLVAPNTTLGDWEWSNPWSIVFVAKHIDFDKLTNTPLILASKGDITKSSNAAWFLEIGDNIIGTYGAFPLTTQACWILQAPTPGIGGSNVVQMQLCSAVSLDLINKATGPYVFTLTSNGGAWTSAFHFYINGIEGGGQSAATYQANNNMGFDPATVAVASGGSGYTAPQNFTVTGGTPGCTITGRFGVSAGVLTTTAIFSDFGCKPADGSPTIVLTAPTGSGATFTVTTHTSTLSTSGLDPLMIGSVSGMSTNSNQSAVTVDELAIFNHELTNQQVVDIWNGVPYYQTLLGARPQTPRKFIFSDDASDMDNNFALNEAIKLHKLGYGQLLGVDNEQASAACPAVWMQYLSQAGLSNIPVSTPAPFGGGGTQCFPANALIYNANTVLSSAPLESSTTLFRTALAANPSTPVDIFIGGPYTGLAAFMQSAADSISPLTGAQLLAQDAANGGRIFDQGNPLGSLTCTSSALPDPYPCSGTHTATSSWDWTSQQYVYANNGSMPIFLMQQTPMSTGPGVFVSRTVKDPFYMILNSTGIDTRQGWDPMVLASLFAPQFYGGLSLGFSGGSGCPNFAPLVASTGDLQGWLKSTSGTPSGVLWPGGGSAYETWQGVGDSYTTAPTVTATGCSGVTLTAFPTLGCVTYSITGISGSTATMNVTSATCSHHYQTPFSSNAIASAGGQDGQSVLAWFVNSLTNSSGIGQPRP